MSHACEQDWKELVRRALGGRKTRTSMFSPKAPTKWHPTSLCDPRSGVPFTEDSCWGFIAEAIQNGAAVEEMVLKMPPGKRGFVLKLAGHDGIAIYVKLQLLADKVMGRSFHESTEFDEKDE